MARIAKSLITLRAQIDAAYPGRSKASDGGFPSAEHMARSPNSDHNTGRAYDFTHDPKHGLDAGKLADTLLASRDPRIKYIISNRRIGASYATGGAMPWTWRPYSGENAHTQHVHVSVVGDPAKYDDGGRWSSVAVGGMVHIPPLPLPPPPPPPSSVSASQRRRMAKAIVDFEARRDSKGRLAVYKLPANDGGGTYEIAGINDRYHPEQAAKLKRLIEAGKYAEAEIEVQDYVLAYTKIAEQWTTDAGVEFYLRDCVFNRGPRGAARILQRAVGVKDDGAVGPVTRAAVAKLIPVDLLMKLRVAREDYERNVVGYRANFWKGLVSRWDKALVQARSFQMEKPPAVPAETKTAGGVAAAGAAGAAVAAQQGMDWWQIGMVVAVAVMASVGAYFMVKWWRAKNGTVS